MSTWGDSCMLATFLYCRGWRIKSALRKSSSSSLERMLEINNGIYSLTVSMYHLISFFACFDIWCRFAFFFLYLSRFTTTGLVKLVFEELRVFCLFMFLLTLVLLIEPLTSEIVPKFFVNLWLCWGELLQALLTSVLLWKWKNKIFKVHLTSSWSAMWTHTHPEFL